MYHPPPPPQKTANIHHKTKTHKKKLHSLTIQISIKEVSSENGKLQPKTAVKITYCIYTAVYVLTLLQ